jgi:coenzyme PQQ biosynthesis protein PqqD
MIALDSRPQLASRVRLRLDKITQQWMLLYPEKGMQLSATAAAIAQLCSGEHTVAQIIEQLLGRYADAKREVVEREVLSFLQALSERGLLR